jgi:hypothetical protein
VRDDPVAWPERDLATAGADASQDVLLAALRVVLAVDEPEAQHGCAGGEIALLDVEKRAGFGPGLLRS